MKKVMKIRKQKKEVAELFDNARVLQETNGLDFFSLFITIVQRLPRYVLMLQDLAKHVPTTEREHKLLTQAIATISTAAQEINERKAAFEDMNALGRLSADIAALPFKLNKPGRRIVESGELQARHGTSAGFKNCKFWLFNDSLLLARQQTALLGKPSKPWKLVHFSFLAKSEFVSAGEDIVSIEAVKTKPVQVRVSGASADWITKMYLARSRAPKKLKDASRSRMSFAQDHTPSGQISVQPVQQEPGCQVCLLQ